MEFHFREVEGRTRMFRENKNDDQRDEEKRDWRLCGMAVWPVDYGAGASLQPVLDSVFACGYKEKDGVPWQNREGSMPSMRRRKREPRRTAIEEED